MVLASVLQLSFRVLAISYSLRHLYVEQQEFFSDPQIQIFWISDSDAMLNFQWPVWESESDNTKFNTPAPLHTWDPCNTNESHDTGERKWLIGPNWIFSLRGVLSFVASGLDINGCVLSYFEGTANLHCYTSCTLITLHCSKVSFLQCCHMKRYNKILTKLRGVVLTSVRCCIYYIYVNMYVCIMISIRLD